MGQIITTQNLVAIKVVRHAGQRRKSNHTSASYCQKYDLLPQNYFLQLA